MTLKFDRWPSETIGHLFYATAIFVHHFVAICKFKLELRSGNNHLGSKSAIFYPVWPWNLMDDLEKQNNRETLLCFFKLYVSLHNHWLIQTQVTTQKGPIWVKIGDILSHVTLIFDGWSWKTIGHLFYATSSFVQQFIAICKLKLDLRSGNAQFGAKFALTTVTFTFDLCPWPFAWTSLFVNGNSSWKFHDAMSGT